MLLDLSDDVLMTLLSDWIHVYDLARLDSVFSKNSEREYLLNLMKSSRFVHSAGQYGLSENALKWIDSREIKVENVLLLKISDVTRLKKYLVKPEIRSIAQNLFTRHI